LPTLDEIVPVDPGQQDLWDECIRIYTAAFPRWERESEGALRRRLGMDRYRMRAGRKNGKIVGLVILDIEPPFKSALLTYLAVDDDERGKGYGTALTEEAIRLFREETECDWLLIEAEDRQAELYGRIGFLKISVDFYVPRFDDQGVVPMHLLALPRHPGLANMSADELKQTLEWIYQSGYLIRSDDPRLAKQLSAVTGDTELIAWPPAIR